VIGWLVGLSVFVEDTENGMVVMWLVIQLMLSSSGLLSLNQHDFGWLVVEDLIKDQINHSNYGT